MKHGHEKAMIGITRPDEIPATFANEEEEAEFWDTHEITEEYVARVGLIPRDQLLASRLHRRAADARRGS